MSNLVGTGLNQVPTNGMLGGLAYQDPNHASIKNLDLKNLSQINSEIADTAVDVFVYDTRKDSDGGAWRKRTQNISWYNETLGTATRGSRKDFPAVAVIVAESNPNKVTIYDGDDPDLPMWMVFSTSTGSGATDANFLAVAGQTLSSVAMLNGDLCIGFPSGNGWGISRVNFVSDSQFWYWTSATLFAQVKNTVAERNAQNGYYNTGSGISGLRNASVNDIAMTVLPNASVDPSIGLPVPTVAVATNGGVSVIKIDGTVSDLYRNSGSFTNSVQFTDNNSIMLVWGHIDNGIRHVNHYSYADWQTDQSNYDQSTGYHELPQFGSGALMSPLRTTSAGVISGFLLNLNGQNRMSAKWDDYGLKIADLNDNDRANGMVAHIRPEYNSGWMHGNCKGAFLSDTDTTDLDGTNLITNGTFDSDVSGWGAGNGATLTHQNNGNPGGNINVASTGSSNGYANQSNTVVVGKYYIISFDHYYVSGNDQGYVNIGTSLGGSQYVYQQLGTSSSWTTYSFTVRATSTNLFTGFYSRPSGGGNVRYDNISLKEAEPDRSINNNGLQVFGTVTKSAVATGADLVSYNFSGSGSNYQQQPYNSDLDFGTGDFSVVYWFNQTEHGTHQDVINRTDAGQNDGSWLIQHNIDGTILFYIRNGGSYASIFSGGGSITNSGWTQVVISRSGTALKQYHNGVEVEDGSSSLSLTLNAAQLRISGRLSTTAYPILAGNSIALARISASAPSAEQVKKMYQDEKVLFQENAKATLYGSSDTVSALAYDDTTELLHVGTSAGRSDFQGLRRINNTTTAVTTAISASNDLVAEQ